jgi:outer membrane immunogenic protein
MALQENDMKKTIATLFLTGTMLVAAPAFAQDVVNTDAAAPIFTGPRVEALLGYDIIGAGSDIDDDSTDGDSDIDGLLYGVGVGFDFSVGGAVVGVEGEYSGSNAKTENGDGFGVYGTEQGRDLYIGARAGILATTNTLVYVKGGYTNTRTDFFARDNAGNRDEAEVEFDGWRIGAGVEHAIPVSIGSGAFAKLEYRYSNYREGNVTFSDAAFDIDDDLPDFDTDLDRHQIVAGVGFRF